LEHGSGSCRKGVLRERKGGKITRAKERERERERERSNRKCRSLPARLQQRRDAQTALSLEEKLRHSPPLQYLHTQTLIYFHNFTKLILPTLSFLVAVFFSPIFLMKSFFFGEKKGIFCDKVLGFLKEKSHQEMSSFDSGLSYFNFWL
jgi:hypothetical protein